MVLQLPIEPQILQRFIEIHLPQTILPIRPVEVQDLLVEQLSGHPAQDEVAQDLQAEQLPGHPVQDEVALELHQAEVEDAVN